MPQPIQSVRTIYILLLLGVLGQVTAIVAAILAYRHLAGSDGAQRNHYVYQIRTFWIGLLYLGIAVLLRSHLVGMLVFVAWLLWLVLRCTKGLRYARAGKDVPRHRSWLL